MPRGADYDDGVPRSDSAIEAGEDKVHGAGKTTDEVGIGRANKTAPLPDLSEVNDSVASGGAALGHEDGHGHDASRPQDENRKKLRKDFGRKSLHQIDLAQVESVTKT